MARLAVNTGRPSNGLACQTKQSRRKLLQDGVLSSLFPDGEHSVTTTSPAELSVTQWTKLSTP